MGDGIPVEELDDEECPKVQSQTKSPALQEVEMPLRCSYRAVRYNQLFDEKAFVYDKEPLEPIQAHTSVFAACHVKEPLGPGLLPKLLELLVLAALASCLRLSRRATSDTFGHHVCQL